MRLGSIFAGFLGMVIAMAILLLLVGSTPVAGPAAASHSPSQNSVSSTSGVPESVYNAETTTQSSLQSYATAPSSGPVANLSPAGVRSSSQTISNISSLEFAGILALIAAAVASSLAFVASRKI